MRLSVIYARFFRSLNYDYLRKSDPGYQADPWDSTPGRLDYPFIKLKLEADITTIVGANESGKSQLLGAIKRGLTGDQIRREDFCRYSPFFSVDRNLVLPEFGLAFRDIAHDDQKKLATLCGIKRKLSVTEAALFRMNEAPSLRIYLRADSTWTVHEVKNPELLVDLGLPTYFEIDAEIPLPDSVPLDYLSTGSQETASSRSRWRHQLDTILENPTWFASPESVASAAPAIHSSLALQQNETGRDLQRYELADKLLIVVTGLERSLFAALRSAIREGNNGYARSIVDTINSELSKSLNFPHWWSQDRFFELFVDLREYDLVFMIKDRTGRTYSFDERSGGLKYFLSYFVQYLSHPHSGKHPREILLMDEPDAYLSSSGQQDLLRIFEAFAHPDNPSKPPVQVVYVTHSPFLIDKNHAERIRVLEKGEFDEGTRVVANASRNHYEPLRSAFGGFVGETTFIGNCNLLVEGQSDQIIIAGASRWLARHEAARTQRLDLNTITLVPAGSASQIPYVAYLARGRDVEKPALIVLLDGDKAGNDARKVLAAGGPHRKQLVNSSFVLQLNDACLHDLVTENPSGCTTIEDLFPFQVSIEATRRYCAEFVPEIDLTGVEFETSKVFTEDSPGLLSSIEAIVRVSTGHEKFHLDKVGFARSCLATVEQLDSADPIFAIVFANFKRLLSELNRLQRAAMREQTNERIRSRINRSRSRFLVDHASGARCEEVSLLIEEVEAQLDDSVEAEEVRSALRKIRVDFHLDEEPKADVADFQALGERLRSVAYQGVRAVQDPGLR